MQMGIYSINNLADRYVQYKQADLGREFSKVEQDRFSYNFQVTGFNVATATAITLLALSIISSSIFLLGLSVLSYALRETFSRSIERNVLNSVLQGREVQKFEKVFGALVNGMANENLKAELAGQEGILEINDAEWEPIALQILDFRLWMNTAPTEDANLAAAEIDHEGQQIANEV
jgi:hypothetical protein